MRFASLGSGSRGNALLVESGTTSVLVDCGFSGRETERRLARLGRSPEGLAAILVTHEHRDHIAGVGVLARRYNLPVWATAGTARHLPGHVRRIGLLAADCPQTIGDLEIHPYAVPHDAGEPVQFLFHDGAVRLGLLTDSGHVPDAAAQALARCDALLVEANHDEMLLQTGPYPPALKRRVGGPLGHLSNRQTAELLRTIDVDRLQHVVALHLSEKNNRQDLVRTALAGALNCAAHWVRVATQDTGLDWCDVRA